MAVPLARKVVIDTNVFIDYLRDDAASELLIALTAWRIGAAVVTRNTIDFDRIQRHLPGLRIVAP